MNTNKNNSISEEEWVKLIEEFDKALSISLEKQWDEMYENLAEVGSSIIGKSKD